MPKTINKIIRKRRTLESVQNFSKESYISLGNIAENGIKFQSFSKLTKKMSISLNEWANYLNLSLRTLQRYNKENLKFDSHQSGRIIELVRLYEKGSEVFGNMEDFNAWLKSYCMALGGIKPIELIDKPFGIQMLEDELGRIEYGIFA